MNGAEGATGSTVNLTSSQGGGVNSRLVLVLLVVCGAVAIIAVVIAAVALNRPPATTVIVQGSSPAAKAGSVSSSRIWSLALGHDYGAYEYIDEKGYLQGFSYDLITEVCAAAGIDCRTIWDKYENCWDSEAGQHAMGGKGLLDSWYDACVGWSETVGRIHVFSFTKPFDEAPPVGFYVKSSDNVFDPTNLNGQKIGFIDGWAFDEKCLARQTGITGNILDVANIVHIKSPEELKDQLINEKIAATFTGEEVVEKWVKDGTLKKVGVDYTCVLGGNAIMTRKDNQFISLWNQGFDKIVNNGKYKEICDKVSTSHGSMGTIKCVAFAKK